MKTIFLLTTLLITVTNIVYAQWTQQYSNLSGLSFYSITMADESNGIVVGLNSSNTSGIIYRTTNGGDDWSEIPGVGPLLYSVSFLSSNVALAVGRNGAIVKTTDGGSSWYSKSSGSSRSLWSVIIRDANTGWAVGGHYTFGNVILKTTDLGETWIEKPCSESDGLLKEIRFISNDVGWAVGYKADGSIIVKTTDGGENWQTLNSGIADCRLETVFFLNENLGWVGGLRDYFGSPKVVLLKTTNGGDTWISQISNKLGNIHSIRMIDTNRGWAVGLGDLWGNQYGLNYETTDGGNIWIHKTEFNDIHMNSIFFLNSTTGWGNSLASIYKYQTATDVNEEIELPSDYSLSQNFPNPFNPTTKIIYSVPQSSQVIIKVFDILGDEIATLVNEEKPAGSYEVEFTVFKNSTRSSGIYFYQLKAGDPSKGTGQSIVLTKKMILLK